MSQVDASESKWVNLEKNLKEGGFRHLCVKGLLNSTYVKLMHCWNQNHLANKFI